MDDRFARGFLSGIIAGIPALIFSLSAQYLKWTNIRWVHFASIFIYGRKYTNLSENLFASFVVFFFCGLLGAIFSFILVKISNRVLLLKSWVFSISIWFFSFAISYLFKVPQLLLIPFNTILSNFVEATIWDLVLGCCLGWFEKHNL